MEITPDLQSAINKLAKAFTNFLNEVKKVLKTFMAKVLEFYEKHKDKIKARAKYERRVRNRQKLYSKNKKKKRRRH